MLHPTLPVVLPKSPQSGKSRYIPSRLHQFESTAFKTLGTFNSPGFKFLCKVGRHLLLFPITLARPVNNNNIITIISILMATVKANPD